MEANAGLIAGSHNRNELVVIRDPASDGVRTVNARNEAPAPLSLNLENRRSQVWLVTYPGSIDQRALSLWRVRFTVAVWMSVWLRCTSLLVLFPLGRHMFSGLRPGCSYGESIDQRAAELRH